MERNISLDILKLVMALMVVCLHAEFLADYSQLGRYLSVNGILRIAVPTFLIINGFYFYQTTINNNEALWLKRVSVLYLFWMAFYSVFWFYIPAFSLYEIMKFIAIFSIGFWHLWYLSGLLGAAIILIILRKKTSQFLLFLSLPLFASGVLIEYLGHYHIIKNPTIDHFLNLHWTHRNFLLFSAPFFFIGYLINKHSIHHKITKKTALVLSLSGLAILTLESYINFIRPNDDQYIDNLASLLLVCPAIFILAIKKEINGRSKTLSLYSSAIYYIHALVLIVLSRYINPGTLLAIAGMALSLAAAFLVIKLNKKVEFIL